MKMDIKTYMRTLGQQARAASAAMARASTRAKNDALSELARLLRDAGAPLAEANARDIAAAEAAGLAAPMVDRLRLTGKVIATMAEGCEQLAAMPDPVGEITGIKRRPTGISVGQMRVPLGVFGMIYESRPNVTIEAASLAIKSGNACILRGGSEAIQSNLALWQLVRQALAGAGLPATAVQLVETTDRAAVGELITMPAVRGRHHPARRQGPDRAHQQRGQGARDQAPGRQLPHLRGRRVRPGEGPGGHRQRQDPEIQPLQRHGIPARARAGRRFLPAAHRRHLRRQGRGDALRRRLQGHPRRRARRQAGWTPRRRTGTGIPGPHHQREAGGRLDEAIAHINQYSSHHTDAILTTNHPNAMRFLREVDSSSVMVNASTRFADGFEYGLGAEIGISTDKIHARGPVGLEGLTSQKWVVLGDGHVRG
jgi:glutamate-5-semialdehyde dehydrogenase